MPIILENYAGSPEEREINRRRATMRRIKILGCLVVLAIGARLIIKDPPPPKKPDYSQDEVRIIPGMLDAIPASERSKINPTLLAKMQKADEDARLGKRLEPIAIARGDYKPSEPPTGIDDASEKIKQEMFTYAKRRKMEHDLQQKWEYQDTKRTTLVRFNRGGHMLVEQTKTMSAAVSIRVDASMHAVMPKYLVSSVLENAQNWEEPIPNGYRKLKPAKGITITVNDETAKRIKIRNENYES